MVREGGGANFAPQLSKYSPWSVPRQRGIAIFLQNRMSKWLAVIFVVFKPHADAVSLLSLAFISHPRATAFQHHGVTGFEIISHSESSSDNETYQKIGDEQVRAQPCLANESAPAEPEGEGERISPGPIKESQGQGIEDRGRRTMQAPGSARPSGEGIE